MNYIAIDTETTGFSYRQHRLIQVAAVRYEDFVETGRFDSWIRVEQSVNPRILRMVGVSMDVLRAAPEQSVVIAGLEDFLAGAKTLCFHNGVFDLPFLVRAGLDTTRFRIADTQSLAQIRVRGLRNYKLETVAEHFGIGLDNAHNALADARATGEIYAALIREPAVIH